MFIKFSLLFLVMKRSDIWNYVCQTSRDSLKCHIWI